MVECNISQWKYLAYEKIPENPNQLNLTESDYRNFRKTDWVVTEKIHGANFGIVTDGLSILFAKRKNFLDSGEDFLVISCCRISYQSKSRKSLKFCK